MWSRYSTAAIRLPKKAAAAIVPAFWCSSTKANLEVRSVATKRYSLPSVD